MSLSIRPLARTFAAELRGVDLRQQFDRSKIEQIYDAFLDYQVVVIPGQALTIEQQTNFAKTFGELWMLPPGNGRRLDNDAISDVSNIDRQGNLAPPDSEKIMFQLGNRLWHSDLSFRDVPAHASMLHALEIASEDGETEFADLYAAYDALSPELRSTLEGMIAEHSMVHSRIVGGYKGEMTEEQMEERFPPSHHPLIRTHPETGRKSLYVGAHVRRILGMEPAESAALIEELIAIATEPERVYRHRWAVHDLVIWDNRCALHRALPFDLGRVRRVMHRVTIAGDGPTVVNGRIVKPVVRRREIRLVS